MPTVCAKVVEKMSSGRPLDAEEKAHMVECESCIAEIVRRLDRTAEESSKSPGMNRRSGQNDAARSRPDAKRAVEHGHRIFAREFGLS